MSTRAVSWKEAFARKLSVLSDARVTPSISGLPVAGSPPSAMVLEFTSWNWSLSMSWLGRRAESPLFSTRTQRSI